MKNSPEVPPMNALDLPSRAHSLETRVRHDLMAHTDMDFSTLVVHRVADGICLEGVVTTSDNVDVDEIAKDVAGVAEIVNRLVVRPK